MKSKIERLRGINDQKAITLAIKDAVKEVRAGNAHCVKITPTEEYIGVGYYDFVLEVRGSRNVTLIVNGTKESVVSTGPLSASARGRYMAARIIKRITRGE